jgi:hypothetical protein
MKATRRATRREPNKNQDQPAQKRPAMRYQPYLMSAERIVLYLNESLESFKNDPPDTRYQLGYQSALEELRRWIYTAGKRVNKRARAPGDALELRRRLMDQWASYCSSCRCARCGTS